MHLTAESGKIMKFRRKRKSCYCVQLLTEMNANFLGKNWATAIVTTYDFADVVKAIIYISGDQYLSS